MEADCLHELTDILDTSERFDAGDERTDNQDRSLPAVRIQTRAD